MAKLISLRDANQRFARIVREVVETGKEVTVTRRGEPAVKIVPARAPGQLSPEQREALDTMFKIAHKRRLSSRGWKFSRDELYD